MTTGIIRYPQQTDPTHPVPSDWPQYSSSELYSATPENSTEGARQVRDLHIKLENVLKGGDAAGGGGGVDRGIQALIPEMLHVDVAMQERYGKLDLADLLKKNKHVKVMKWKNPKPYHIFEIWMGGFSHSHVDLVCIIPGASQIWIDRGCTACSSRPIPIFRGNFSKIRYPYLGIFLKKGTHFL